MLAAAGLLLLAGLFFGAGGPTSAASAQSLTEVLSEIYRSSPDLLAARQTLRARDELRPQALSGWMPTVQVTGTRLTTSQSNLNARGARFGDSAYELSYSQNLYRGGSDTAALRRSEALIRQQRALLLDTEQELLLQGTTVYMDVLRDEGIVEARLANVAALRENMRQTEAQYRIGDRTEADRAQAGARLASADADLLQARGDLEVSRTRFEEVVGYPPRRLVAPSRPAAPTSQVDILVRDGLVNDPRVINAAWAVRAATETIRAIEGEAAPSVDVVARVTRNRRAYDSSFPDVGNTDRTVGVQLTVPLYQGGGVGARAREARHTAGQRVLELQAERRRGVRRIRSAWERLRAVEATQVSLRRSVEAAQLALSSTRRAVEIGEATVLDMLNAERDLVNERVRLASADRDLVVLSYGLSREVGELTAEQLRLPVEIFDPIAHYEAVRWNVFPDLLTIFRAEDIEAEAPPERSLRRMPAASSSDRDSDRTSGSRSAAGASDRPAAPRAAR